MPSPDLSATGTPDSRNPAPLVPMLESAHADLAGRLAEVCNHDVRGESTAEMMRLEETLSDAAQVAKQAISLRRRLRTGHGGTHTDDDDDGASAEADANANDSADASGADAESAIESSVKPAASSASGSAPAVRELSDRDGQMWRVWSVSAEQLHTERQVTGHLGEYRKGWLAFEALDGSERRRLPDIRDDWTALSDSDLRQLLECAERVKVRTRERHEEGGEQQQMTT